MAFRIGEHVVCGELNNTRRNTVFGWLDFGNDTGIRLELTGNLEGDLQGKHVRFQCKHPGNSAPQLADDRTDGLEFQQIGVTGSMLLRRVRIPLGPIEEFYLRCKMNEPPPIDEKPCIYLEWYSQNGRVVAEIVDPVIAYGPEEEPTTEAATPEPLPDPSNASGPDIVGFSTNEEGETEEFSLTDDRAADQDHDPYQLFPADLDKSLRDANSHDTEPGDRMLDGATDASRPRTWDEVIPGIDEETKKLYEQWDEVCHGEKDEPLAALFDPPLSLKQPDDIADEAEADTALKVLLMRLALHCVAVDVCEHFTSLDTYRWLLEEILPEAQIHPQLSTTGFVQHYSTWESCPQCEAEFEADYKRRERDRGDAGENA